MPSNNPQELISKHLPLVAAWVAELDHSPENVKTINASFDVVRDLEREKAEHSRWKFWKYGERVTITLVFTDNMIKTRSFNMNEWESQSTAEA